MRLRASLVMYYCDHWCRHFFMPYFIYSAVVKLRAICKWVALKWPTTNNETNGNTFSPSVSFTSIREFFFCLGFVPQFYLWICEFESLNHGMVHPNRITNIYLSEMVSRQLVFWFKFFNAMPLLTYTLILIQIHCGICEWGSYIFKT